ncbi:MAG: hypothetical protein R3E79_14070 [Caldilineaceae bacterium]
MPLQATGNRTSAAEAIHAVYLILRRQLEEKRDQIYDEIRSYTPPIPACDVQFNTLLETRSAVARELSHLNSLAKQTPPWQAQLSQIDEFIMASTCLPQEAKQQIQASLEPLRAAVAA